MPLPSARAALLVVAAALAACAAPASAPSPVGDDGRAARITALLLESAEEWNRGSLDGFLLPYLDSPATTFVGSSGLVRGKEAIRAQYGGSWFRGGQPAGTLAFRDVEVRPLGPAHALAVGRWSVTNRASGAQQSGTFSLVLERTPEGWRIVHDHSS